MPNGKSQIHVRIGVNGRFCESRIKSNRGKNYASDNLCGEVTNNVEGLARMCHYRCVWRHDRTEHHTPVVWGLISSVQGYHRRKRSPTACFITAPPTSAMERVRGMSLGQISTQFCAYPHS